MAGCQCIVIVQFLFRGITFFKKLIDDLELFGKGIGLFIIFNPFLLGTQVFNDYFSLFGIVPEVRRKGFFFFVGYLD